MTGCSCSPKMRLRILKGMAKMIKADFPPKGFTFCGRPIDNLELELKGIEK